jgi:Fe-S oxidoreductase
LRRVGVELALRPFDQNVVLHGHCHQKALVGAQDTLAMLKTVPGANVQLVDSGCCGMAGSFGYEHYDMSMAIGERVLFPAVRKASTATIIAPGFSCRQQIAQGTGRAAQHPVQLLAQQLRG